jgi:large subunit ribosomal protein L30
MAKSFRVKLIKGLSGTTQSQRDAVRCLGLGRLQSESVVKDNPANRGQIYKVQHLLQVKVEK